LKQLAEAEGGDGGELDIFEHVLAVLDDPEVRKLVRIHKEDEERHERLYFERMRANVEQGNREGGAGAGEPLPLPKSGHLLRRLDDKLGFFTKPVVDRAGVVEAYMLLLVIEERAMKQFAKYEIAFARAGDADTAAVIAQVRADEERHLRYCEAITRRYSADESVRQQKLAAYRALEEQCFDEVQGLNLRMLVAAGMVGKKWWSKPLWSTLADVAKARLPQDLREISSQSVSHILRDGRSAGQSAAPQAAAG
jgi:rubrerythrin